MVLAALDGKDTMTPAEENATGRGDDRDALLFGAVRFEAGGSGLIRETVVAFRTAADADRYATEHGWSGHQVCPLRFLVSGPLSGDGFMVHGGVYESLSARRRRVR